MNLVESFRIALRALNANKVRSALTMLGVIIGVAAVILLVSIGTGVQNQITGQIAGLGSNLLFVIPGKLEGGGGPGSGMGKKFTLDDVNYLQTRLGSGNTVIPEFAGAADLRRNNQTMNGTIAASDQNVADAAIGTITSGRWYGRGEVVGASRVAVIGSNVRDTLFPGQDPLGAQMDINGQSFRVIGLLEKKGGGIGGSQDNFVSIPITTAQQLLGTRDITELLVRVDDQKTIDAAKIRTEIALRPRYTDQFTVFTQAQTLSLLGTILGTLTAMLAGLASISLLVGGIGIMNIMLVSVTERTREIGIRKALGATKLNIVFQFLIEAVVLCLLGGMLGFGVGAGGAMIFTKTMGWNTEVGLSSVVIAFGFSAFVGVVFGVYPARRAAGLDPIVALRYE